MENFPREIIERILQYLDGHSLINCGSVCKLWLESVNYVAKKCNLWEKSCLNDLRAIDFYAVSKKYVNCPGENKWETIFKNWKKWQKLDKRVFKMVQPIDLSLLNMSINCAKLSGNILFLGDSAGYIVSINLINNSKTRFLVSNGDLEEFHFLNEKPDYSNKGLQHTHLLVKFEGLIKIFEISMDPIKLTEKCIIPKIIQYSIYKSYLSYVCQDGLAKVKEMCYGKDPFLVSLTICRLFSPCSVKSLSIFNTEVYLVTCSHVMEFSFGPERPMSHTIAGSQLSLPSYQAEQYWTFYNEVIFCTVATLLYCEIIEFPVNKTKIFNTSEILGSVVCDILLHGNILIISLQNGAIYMYIIENWIKFDLDKFNFKSHVASEPIISIDIQESEKQKIILATPSRVYECILSDPDEN